MNNLINFPPWRVGVDVGGTFTDLVIADCQGHIEVFKVENVFSNARFVEQTGRGNR